MIWYFSIISQKIIKDIQILLIEHEHAVQDKIVADEYSVVIYKLTNYKSVLSESKFNCRNDALNCYDEKISYYNKSLEETI